MHNGGGVAVTTGTGAREALYVVMSVAPTTESNRRIHILCMAGLGGFNMWEKLGYSQNNT